ncbi:MAG: hypothetical protein HYW34_03390 [Candidatus Brennerbacteria bacterium]|nr:hypothetical protein [Candidatus Brennerbacteria bacterium]
MFFNLIIQSIKEFFVYLRDFDKGDLSAFSGKLRAVVSEVVSDKNVQDILKILSGWFDKFNYYIGAGLWNLLVKIFKAIGAFLILIFEASADLIRIVLSWLQ